MKRHSETASKDNSSIGAGQAACFMMPVALFAAPVEQRVELAKVVAALVTTTDEVEHAAPAVSVQRTPEIGVYRPPPLDRRSERLLNCVIRI